MSTGPGQVDWGDWGPEPSGGQGGSPGEGGVAHGLVVHMKCPPSFGNTSTTKLGGFGRFGRDVEPVLWDGSPQMARVMATSG